MNEKSFYAGIDGVEAMGEKVGVIFGKIIKTPVRGFIFLASFLCIAGFAFIYASIKGVKKS